MLTNLLAQIAQLEQYILTNLFPRFKKNSALAMPEMHYYLGTEDGMRGGRLGELYNERDMELWKERLLERTMSVETTLGTANIKFLGTDHTAKRSRTCKGKRYKNKPREQRRPKSAQAKQTQSKDKKRQKKGHGQAA